MIRVLRCVTATTALFCGLLTVATPAAADIDPAIAGSWSGRNPDGGVTLSVSKAGALSGSVTTRSGFDCRFSGEVSPRITGRVPSASRVSGEVSLTGCSRPGFGGRYRVQLGATPPTLDIQMSDGRNSFAMEGLTRSGPLLGSGAAVQIVSPDIPGHWQGVDHDITVALDLANNGAVSATLSGTIASIETKLDGCVLKAEIAPDEAFQNEEDSFVGMGLAWVQSCTDATLDGVYAILLAAAPDHLGISVIRSNNKLLFEAQELTRTTPALGSSFPSQIVNTAIPGLWIGRSGQEGATLEIRANGALLHGKLFGANVGGCQFTGMVAPDEALENDAEDFAAFGVVTLSRCARPGVRGLYAILIGATSTSLSLTLIDRANDPLFEIEGLRKFGPP